MADNPSAEESDWIVDFANKLRDTKALDVWLRLLSNLVLPTDSPPPSAAEAATLLAQPNIDAALENLNITLAVDGRVTRKGPFTAALPRALERCKVRTILILSPNKLLLSPIFTEI